MPATLPPEIVQESARPAQPLSDFIRSHHTAIIDQFEAFASTFAPVASAMTSAELRDHAEELLAAIVDDLAESQSARDELSKSRGEGTRNAMQASGNLHADARILHRFNAAQVIAEFRALRASVLRLYEESGGPIDMPGVRRFNEAIDEALTASMIRFSEGVDRYRDQFIGVLGHDLRTPLGAITAGASLLTMPTCDGAQRARVGAMILTSARRMADMIADLMDLTRFRLGAGVLVDRAPADLGDICQSVVLELRALHPSALISYDVIGELRGSWDSSRLAQVAANLIGNALEHGTPGAQIYVAVTGLPEHAVLRVHNTGVTIPPERRAAMFEPMVRYTRPGAQASGGIGLGLFIVRSIVLAHGGTVEMTSSDADGTTFEVVLPRM